MEEENGLLLIFASCLFSIFLILNPSFIATINIFLLIFCFMMVVPPIVTCLIPFPTPCIIHFSLIYLRMYVHMRVLFVAPSIYQLFLDCFAYLMFCF